MAGVIPFASADDAAVAVERVSQDYEGHCRAAREVAEAYFDSDAVLTRLIDDAFDADR